MTLYRNTDHAGPSGFIATGRRRAYTTIFSPEVRAEGAFESS